MRAKYRIDMSSGEPIVSDGINAGGSYTFVTDWWTEIVVVQRKERILVVEPDDLILGLLERWLGEAGYTLVVESSLTPSQVNGDAAEPHLVIIDVPDPLGAEQIIKSVRQAHASPILLLSARFTRGTASSISVARQLGVRGVLPKPFTCAELLSAVSESIGAP